MHFLLFTCVSIRPVYVRLQAVLEREDLEKPIYMLSDLLTNNHHSFYFISEPRTTTTTTTTTTTEQSTVESTTTHSPICFVCPLTMEQPEPLNSNGFPSQTMTDPDNPNGTFYVVDADLGQIELATPDFPICSYSNNLEWEWNFIVSDKLWGNIIVFSLVFMKWLPSCLTLLIMQSLCFSVSKQFEASIDSN